MKKQNRSNSNIYKNIQEIRKEIQSFNPHAKLIVVTKNQPVNVILEVIEAGIENIGENRIEEFLKKEPYIPSRIKKHFIGNIQSKKVEAIVKHFDLIHSVDRIKIVEKISKEAKKIGKIQSILVQVNTSQENQKGGIKPSEIFDFIQKAISIENIKILGLMTMAQHTENESHIRKSFQNLSLFTKKTSRYSSEKHPLNEISMGMTNDYKIALEEGSTCLRIGSGIFKDYSKVL